MLLARVQDVRETIRFDDIEEMNIAIYAALESATADLSNILRTGFDRKTNTDMFFIETGMQIGGSDKELFMLRNGFVAQSPSSFGIIRADTVANLGAAPVNVAANCTIDYEKGLVNFLS